MKPCNWLVSAIFVKIRSIIQQDLSQSSSSSSSSSLVITMQENTEVGNEENLSGDYQSLRFEQSILKATAQLYNVLKSVVIACKY